ncbi:hypothetical protein D9M72_593950 [compost metagenome]
MRRYMEAYSGKAEVLQALLQEYRIRWAVIEPTSPAAHVFRSLPGWHKIHEDAVAVAYVLHP